MLGLTRNPSLCTIISLNKILLRSPDCVGPVANRPFSLYLPALKTACAESIVLYPSLPTGMTEPDGFRALWSRSSGGGGDDQRLRRRPLSSNHFPCVKGIGTMKETHSAASTRNTHSSPLSTSRMFICSWTSSSSRPDARRRFGTWMTTTAPERLRRLTRASIIL